MHLCMSGARASRRQTWLRLFPVLFAAAAESSLCRPTSFGIQEGGPSPAKMTAAGSCCCRILPCAAAVFCRVRKAFGQSAENNPSADLGLPLTDKAEAAPVLLAVADEAGLPALRATALDWMVHNYAAAAGTAAYRALTKEQSDLVAAAACALFQRCQTLLQVILRFRVVCSPSRAQELLP